MYKFFLVSSLFNLKIFSVLTNNITNYKKVGNVSTLKNGYPFKNNQYNDNGKYNILTISNVNGEKYISTNFKNKYNFIPDDIQPHQKLKFEDILISMTGNIGRVSYNVGENNLLNQRVGLLEVNKDENKDYIFYILNNKKFENQMINLGQGAAQLNISKSDIENYLLDDIKNILTLLVSVGNFAFIVWIYFKDNKEKKYLKKKNINMIGSK